MKARNYQFINFFIDYLVDHDNWKNTSQQKWGTQKYLF